MSKMQIQPGPNDRFILGPCPGCDLWTLEYGRQEVIDIFGTVEQFHAFVEGLLAEHLAECLGLQEIINNTH
jgi:hypothetical protein